MPSEQTLQLLSRLPFLGPPEADDLWDGNREPGSGYYDRQGEPLTFRQWGMLHSLMEYKAVAQTTVGHYWISTVWLGLDHSFGEGPPVIFETMVFRSEESDLECQRYATEAEAIAGHLRMVRQVKALLPLEGCDAGAVEPA